jgi:3-oxoacyl-[acyl-carrier protein] reductase
LRYPTLTLTSPGAKGHCLRLVGIDEDFFFHERAGDRPNVREAKEAVRRLGLIHRGNDVIMDSSQILEGKRAVVFGAGGSVGAAVAKEFAAEGAEVFLAGRTKAPLDELAKQIKETGGTAHAAVVDALDMAAVDRYVDDIEQNSGKIDIEFTAVGPRVTEFGNGKLAVDLTIDEFMVPVNSMLKAQFIAARSVARHMIKRKSGVIIFLTGSNARGHNDGASAIGTAFGAIETFMENFAYEISPHGVRAVCLRTTANVDTRAIQETLAPMAA